MRHFADTINANMFRVCLNRKIYHSKKNNKNNDIGLSATECYFEPSLLINYCIKDEP